MHKAKYLIALASFVVFTAAAGTAKADLNIGGNPYGTVGATENLTAAFTVNTAVRFSVAPTVPYGLPPIFKSAIAVPAAAVNTTKLARAKRYFPLCILHLLCDLLVLSSVGTIRT